MFRKHKDKVFGFAFALLRNRQDAEDVTQDVFINLWKHWDSIDQKKAEAWIMRSTHNRCIDLIRRRKNSVHKTDNIERIIPFHPELVINGPDRTFELDERQSQLIEVLSELPEKMQSMMVMFYFQDMKLQTISEVMEININTVKVFLHRGRKLLKTALEKSYPELVGSSA